MRPQVSVRFFCLDTDVSGAAEPAGLADLDLVAATGIRDAQQRRRFLASRRAVRTVLGEQIGCPPERVPIQTGSNGKPELAGHEVHFSVSRRRCCCAVATSRTHPVGVDVEVIQPPAAWHTVVDAFFPAPARSAVLAAPRVSRPHEFAIWWCRIESAVKACGAVLDEAELCMAVTRQVFTVIGRRLAVAVAVHATEPFDTDWVIR
jgi:4'-phosphopantetheinyl transferase